MYSDSKTPKKRVSVRKQAPISRETKETQDTFDEKDEDKATKESEKEAALNKETKEETKKDYLLILLGIGFWLEN
ncbi:uncharacterized protein LY89DRAFT_739052 [Mollisia scopiformis]|uniref:Uncharacterized protein n=1 Tax=Mollisia scopiformis TaxID=149040 RepID=A0A194WUJ2_MOLSC|nr:uncharacterized protein LY89DRAFT_739052 [Mollisia scopiformis]KUJ11625.1 hypothetical protein LY89DRAFT_739052 [Mollisia scopiformis]